MATQNEELLAYLQSLGLGNMQTQGQGQENLLGIPMGQVTNPMANVPQNFAQDFANYQSIPMGAQYNPSVVGGAESPYARIMGLMNAMPKANLNPYASLTGGYNPNAYKAAASGAAAGGDAGGVGGLIDLSGGGGVGVGGGGGMSAIDGVGMSGMGVGNIGVGNIGVTDSNVANSITGLAQAANNNIGVSDMGTMSDAAMGESMGLAAADSVGMSGMGDGGVGAVGATDGNAAADGVGASGIGDGGGGIGGVGGDGGGGGGGGGGAGCFFTTAAVAHMGQKDNGKVLNTLRKFRDTYMRKNKEKSKDVEWYYKNAPRIVAALDDRPDAAKIYKKMYREYIKPAYDAIQKGDQDRAYQIYKEIIDFSKKESGIDSDELTPRYGSKAMLSGGLIGDYIIKEPAVKKYGRGILDMINEGKIPAKKIKSLLD